MKKKLQNSDWVRLTIIVLLLLNIMLTVDQSAGAAPDKIYHNDKWLLTKAITYVNSGYYLGAAEYLRAFLERDPIQLKNNPSESTKYNNLLKKIEGELNLEIGYGKKVEASLKACGRYDCSNSHYSRTHSYTDSSIYLPPLPDQAIFYTGYSCTGGWIYMSAGSTSNIDDYSGFYDNSIRGVLVGSGVKVIMCTGRNLTGNCATFTSDYCNLSQHWIRNDVTSVKVIQD